MQLKANSVYRAAFLLILATLASTLIWAQGTRGTISGIIRDTSGAVIPGVSVTVTNDQTGFKTTAVSLADGFYQAPQLLPGNHTVSAEHAGFKRLSISGLKLDISSTLTQDLTLEVGAVTETMKVTGQTSFVETASAEVSTTVNLDQVLEMPLVDRNVFNLVNLTPGGVFYSTGQSRAYINGSRGWETLGTLDGVSNMRGPLGTQNIEMAPPVDSVQEFKVQASNFSSEFGRSGGAMVTAATKSGTNAFHGVFYEFLRNDKFDAKGWGVDTMPPLRRNNFGATIGGPIRKNKLFFFYNYDGLRNRGGSSVTRDVGLPEWRTGNFSTATRQSGTSAVVVPIYDPETGTGTIDSPRGNSPFPGNIIPTSRLDPVALKALAFIPVANRKPDNPYTQQGNWQLNRVATTTRDYHMGRVDYDLSAKTKMYFRTFFSKPDNTLTPALEGWGAADMDSAVGAQGRQNQALNVTHLFSPTLFGNFTMGYNRTFLPGTTGGCCGTDFSALLGMPNTPGAGFPRLGINTGNVVLTNIGNPLAIRLAVNNAWEWIGNFTKIKNTHTLKFGAQMTRFGGALIRLSGGGTYNFDGRYTRGATATGSAVANTGISVADALLGRMISVANEQQPSLGKRIQYYGVYFQDDWRVTPNLTLNLGLRYDTETPPYEVAGRNSNFELYAPNPLAGTGDIPAGAIGTTTFQNRNGSGKYLTRFDKNNFAPRVGFAYRLFGSSNTSIRGGYGLYFSVFGDAVAETGKEPFAQSYAANYPVGYRLRDGMPAGVIRPVSEADLKPYWGNRGTRFERSSSVIFLDSAAVTPYSQDLSLTLQHQWKGILLEAGYRGNLARQLNVSTKYLNRIPPELLSHTEIPERLRRPWTIFASDQGIIQSMGLGWGIANYHAFVFKTEKRFQNGIGWTLSYTRSKQIDNATFIGGTQLGDNDQEQNYFNRKGERALSAANIDHRLVLSPMVDLPFGKGRKWMNRGGVLNAVLGGWQVATMGTMQTGFPFGVTVNNGGRDLLGDGASLVVLRPNLVADPNSALKGEPAVGVRGLQWLEPSAFANPPRYTYGNAARKLPGVNQPGMISFDSMVGKNFRIGERYRAQFRWETFNTFNTPQFARPADTFGGANFGVSTGASGKRIMQLGLKVYW